MMISAFNCFWDIKAPSKSFCLSFFIESLPQVYNGHEVLESHGYLAQVGGAKVTWVEQR
jgi:hypothetical protein